MVFVQMIAKRALEKQASRDEDERRLAAGEISRAELAKENGAFCFPRDRIRIGSYAEAPPIKPNFFYECATCKKPIGATFSNPSPDDVQFVNNGKGITTFRCISCQ